MDNNISDVDLNKIVEKNKHKIDWNIIAIKYLKRQFSKT